MSVRLIAYTPTKEVFDAYYYGYGKVLSQETLNLDGGITVCTIVDYGDDSYRAKYQEGRFWSGLYHAEVTEV